jgi:methionyl aminopeptidase
MSIFGKIIPTTPLSPALADRIADLAARQGDIFLAVIARLRVGMSTADVAQLVRQAAADHDVQLSFKEKLHFPDDVSICLNNEIMNGIPSSSKVLKNGDLLKISFGLHHALSAFSTQTWTIHIGSPNDALSRLLNDTRACVSTIAAGCKAGVKVSAIAKQTDAIITGKGWHLSKTFAGHAIGAEPIIEPTLIARGGLFGHDHVLTEGTIISLLVLAHQGKPRTGVREDNWTVYDRDCHLAACYSVMLKVTAGEPQLLTRSYPIHIEL